MGEWDGLKRADAPPVVEVRCAHAKWHRLNAATGCIHPDHGSWPPDLVDPHSGLRLIDGNPTRFVSEAAA